MDVIPERDWRVISGMALTRVARSVRWRTDGLRSYARAYRATSGWHRAERVPVRLAAGTGLVPVIFCTFRRVERLRSTLDMLAAQDVPVQAVIWDNSSPPHPETVDKIVSGARIPVTVHHCSRNIGGFGRFYLTREAALAGHQRVVFVDDDQDFGPTAVSDLLAACPERGVASCWAWRIRSQYGDRERAGAGERADYAGTGGMAASASLFTEAGLFLCPRPYWFAEDLWLSLYCRSRRYDVLGARPDVTEIIDGRNQNDSLGWVKRRLWRSLQ